MPKHISITDTVASKLRAPKTGQADHFDSSLPGLALRISSGGRRTWTYFYRVHGKQRRLTIGVYPAVSVKQVHAKWIELRDAVASGKDPGADPAEGTAVDVATVIAEWLKRDQEGNRTYKQTASAMERYVISVWDHRAITSITRRDCLNVIDKIVDAGHVIQARRTHQQLHRLFRWCVGRGIVTANPMAHLPKPGSENHRERVLTDDELVKVWKQFDKIGVDGAAFKLLVLTGARRDEIAHLKWSEIEDGNITLEGNRTKNGKPHIIPLSAPAWAIIDSLPRTSEFALGGAGLNNWSRTKRQLDELVQLDQPWRTHDLRRTCATGLQALGVALTVTEAILNHTGGTRGGIVGVYQRHTYKDEKRAALEAWGARVLSLVESKSTAKVLPMRKRGR